MDVLARDRPFGVPDESRDRNLGESEVVRNACEAVPQYMRCDIGERRIAEDLLPMIGETAERVIGALAWEEVSAGSGEPLRSRYSTTGNPMARVEAPSLLSARRRKLASISASIHLSLITLRTATSRESNLADDISRHLVSIFLSRRAQDFSGGRVGLSPLASLSPASKRHAARWCSGASSKNLTCFLSTSVWAVASYRISRKSGARAIGGHKSARTTSGIPTAIGISQYMK